MQMEEIILYLVILIALFFIELLYFRLTDHFNIIDKPNERSSHTSVTIRGGGVVFFLGALITFFVFGFQYPLFIVSLTALSVVSFLDDILTLSSKIRLPIQLASVLLLMIQIFGTDDWTLLLIGLVVATGAINAFNFMDGINGITGGYSLVTLVSLWLINRQIAFVQEELLVVAILSLLVFNFFNFRRKAKCFAGDVGSVSIAVIIVFSLFRLCNETQSIWWLLMIFVYGMDSVVTILHRLLKRENIFEAHRSHLYQWLVKPGPFSHLQMSAVYAVLQLLINGVVIAGMDWPLSGQVLFAVIVWLILGFTYLFVKRYYIKKFGLV